jgi:hypothetical protein
MNRLLPLSFIKTTTSCLLPEFDDETLSSLASGRCPGLTGQGKATTMTAPRKVAVKRLERRDRCLGAK